MKIKNKKINIIKTLVYMVFKNIKLCFLLLNIACLYKIKNINYK
jgi:hypothetical protein